jgi:hypothetical protein
MWGGRIGNHGVEGRFMTHLMRALFNWGDPVTNFNAATFGLILTQTGDPRIMQFGIKYGF